MVHTRNKNEYILNIFIVLTLIFLPLMFISDGVSKYLNIQNSEFARISLITRFLFEIFVLFYIMKNIKYTYKEIMLIILLFLFFILGQYSIDNYDNFLENFINYNKYIFFILVFLFFSILFYLNNKINKQIYTILTFLFLLNIFSIFLGFIFKLYFFKSFPFFDYRFGYNGIFLAGNESSFVLISMISFFYFRAFYENGKKIYLLLSIIACLLCGMKAVYVFILLLSVFHILLKTKKINFIWIIPLLFIFSLCLLEYFLSEEFQILVKFFIDTTNEKGFFWMMLSGRQDFINMRLIPQIENWNMVNYFIGGQNFPKNLIEMDFLDLFLFFGLIGSFIYLYVFYKLIVKKLLWHKFFTFFIFIIFLLAFLGGHFFTSPTTAIYFSLVVLYFQNYRLEYYEKNSIN